MKKGRRIFSSPEFSCFIFIVYFILFNWPFLSIFDKGDPQVIFYYCFILWAVGIAVLYLMSREWQDEKDEDKNHKKEEV